MYASVTPSGSRKSPDFSKIKISFVELRAATRRTIRGTITFYRGATATPYRLQRLPRLKQVARTEVLFFAVPGQRVVNIRVPYDAGVLLPEASLLDIDWSSLVGVG